MTGRRSSAALALIADAVEELKLMQPAGATVRLRRELVARRAGRNQVWQFAAPAGSSKRYYVKFWDCPRLFARELKGHEIVSQLAATHDWLLPSPVVLAHQSIGAIVTEEIPGPTLARTLAAADRSLSFERRRRTLRRAQDCLSLIRRFLRELHAFRCSDDPALADHRLLAIVGRINRGAAKLQAFPQCAGLPELASFPISITDVSALKYPGDVLVYGDLSPANVIFDGRRVGFLDFEDFGVGAACRDDLWINYLLKRSRSGRSLLRRDSTVPTPVHALYRLEFLVMHAQFALRSVRSPGFVDHLRSRVECYRVLREFRKHCAVLRNEPWIAWT